MAYKIGPYQLYVGLQLHLQGYSPVTNLEGQFEGPHNSIEKHSKGPSFTLSLV